MSVLGLPEASHFPALKPQSATYDRDIRSWAFEQAAALRRGHFPGLDAENVTEELESLGKQQEHQLYKRYLVLTAHLLKWSYQPERRGPSWEGTIVEQRARIEKLMRRSPSLKSVQLQEFVDAYKAGRGRASKETTLPLSVFPLEPPFTLEQASNPAFWPEAAEL